MVRQVKIFHRYEAVCYPPKRGLLREMKLTDDEEHCSLIRAKRGRAVLNEIVCSWYCWMDLEFYLHHSRRDLKSWKSRCKKRHQWETHRHTKAEYENTRYCNAGKAAVELYRWLSTQQGEIVLDVRTDHLLDDALCLLEKRGIVSVGNVCLRHWLDPLRRVKLTGKQLYQAHEADSFEAPPPESDRYRYKKQRRHRECPRWTRRSTSERSCYRQEYN